MSADAILMELRQLELDRQKHEKAIKDIDARRRELLETNGTRRPITRKHVSVADVGRSLGVSGRQK